MEVAVLIEGGCSSPLSMPRSLFASGHLTAQKQVAADGIANKMQWFADAKLGIYSVKGVDESWAFFKKKMSHADHMKQISGFTANK